MYVQRDESGKVQAVYESKQPDMAEEFLPDDSPEIAEFFSDKGETEE